jgi:hypothetical protein
MESLNRAEAQANQWRRLALDLVSRLSLQLTAPHYCEHDRVWLALVRKILYQSDGAVAQSCLDTGGRLMRLRLSLL